MLAQVSEGFLSAYANSVSVGDLSLYFNSVSVGVFVYVR
jgi:hypothetical protein